MSTPIQPVPDLVLAAEFPSLADRPAGTYNQKAKLFADSANPMSVRNREIAVVTHNNALAATEQANIALQAVPAAGVAEAARDKALEYRDSAQVAAAAAGSAAGLPSLAGNARKALLVGDDEESVGWYDVLPALGHREVTTAETAGVADRSVIVDCSGTFTLSFASVASLGDGWFIYLKNSGTGDITLDPAGSETIDGLTSYIMYPGEVRLIQCDGSVLRSVVLNSFYKVFESSGDFVKPPGYRLFEGLLWGAGSGGVSNNNSGSSPYYYRGGIGGSCIPFLLPNEKISSVEPVVIGSGSPARTASFGPEPIPGGNSQFAGGTAYGGGVMLRAQTPANGVLTSGFLSARYPNSSSPESGMDSDYGGASGAINTNSAPTIRDNKGGDSIYGGGGGASGNGPAGKSMVGGDGGSAAVPAKAPGGGGYISGSGARGELRIWGII